MTLRCKPGDLAIVVGERWGDGSNIGMLVEVIRRAVPKTETMPDGSTWTIKDDEAVWIIKSLGKQFNRAPWVPSYYAAHGDARLRPITPPGTHTDIPQREPITETA